MSDTYVPKFEDVCELMKQLATMANMDYAGTKKMVLVLDVEAIPTLYVESYLDRKILGRDELHKIDLNVVKGPVDVRETTTIQNEIFRTYVPLEQQPTVDHK